MNLELQLQQYLPLAVLKQSISHYSFVMRYVVLQQYLPLAVLKLQILKHSCFKFCCVATVLTACGIETVIESGRMIPRLTVATVLTACGIETLLP